MESKLESISVRQTLRPTRYAFLIAPDDRESLLKVVGLNSLIWGGIFNPIVPTDDVKSCNSLLRSFDPEFLVTLGDATVPPVVRSAFDFRIIPEEAIISNPGVRVGRRLKIGLSIAVVLKHIYDSELKGHAIPSRARLFLDVPAAWREYTEVVYGCYKGVPEFESIALQTYKHYLRPTEVPFEPSQECDPDNWVHPISATGYHIRSARGLANVSSHVVYIGNHENKQDLIDFWNIRASGRTAVFVPAICYRNWRAPIMRVLRDGNYPINQELDNHADIQRAPSVDASQFEEIANWVTGLDTGTKSIRTWVPRYDNASELYVGDIHASELHGSWSTENVLLFSDRMTPVKLVQPPFADDGLVLQDHYWTVELDISNPYGTDDLMCSFPEAPGVDELVRQSATGRSESEVRVRRSSLIVTPTFLKDHLNFHPIRTFEVFKAILEASSALRVQMSDPGRYADQIIRKMGSLQFGCRIFKYRGVRSIIHKLSCGSILTKNQMSKIFGSRVADSSGQFWHTDFLESALEPRVRFDDLFNTLLKNQVIRPGLELACSTCRKVSWYHVSEFSEEYICRYCFTKERVDFGRAREWQYKSDGMFQIPGPAQGSVAVLVTLWRMQHEEFHTNARYITGVEFAGADGSQLCEVDFCFLSRNASPSGYELVLGEAKAFDEYDEPKLRRLTQLADRFPTKPALVVSTLKDEFARNEKAILNKLRSEGYRLIPLTRMELDPYDLFDRFEHAPHKHAVTLKQLEESCVYVNLRDHGASLSGQPRPPHSKDGPTAANDDAGAPPAPQN